MIRHIKSLNEILQRLMMTMHIFTKFPLTIEIWFFMTNFKFYSMYSETKVDKNKLLFLYYFWFIEYNYRSTVLVTHVSEMGKIKS